MKQPAVARTALTSFATSSLWLLAILFALVLGQPAGNWTYVAQAGSSNSATGTLSGATPANLPKFQPRNTSSTVSSDAPARLAEPSQLSSDGEPPAGLLTAALDVTAFFPTERSLPAIRSPLRPTSSHNFDARAPPPHAA